MLNQSNRNPWKFCVLTILGAGLFFQFKILIETWQSGGHMWLQGDWLVSLAAGPIRRGAFGEAFLAIADAFGVSPLDAVVLVQGLVVLALFLGFARLVSAQSQSVMVLAVLSPGIFAILWSIDPISALRKEMIGLVALIWLALPGGGMGRLIASGALMVAGGLGHEIMILMTPAWLVATWLFLPELLAKRAGQVVVATVFFLGFAEGLYALKFADLADASPICAALTERGMAGSPICDGAIAWLADPENGPDKVVAALQRSWTVWLLPIAWLVASAPLLRLWSASSCKRKHAGWLILASIAPICLLYLVGLDWGRWFAVQITIAATLMLGLGLRGNLVPVRQISSRERTIWLVSALSWGFLHDPIITTRGFFVQLVDLLKF